MTRPAQTSDTTPPWSGPVLDRIGRWIDAGVGTHWIVGVSGGSDSVGLLRFLHEHRSHLGLDLTVAHLNHGVRGPAAQADAAFVAELARALELPFELGTWQPNRSSHFEADARRARYEWLAQVAHDRAASVVAVAHTRDDQAETVLHRIVRGTGPGGLAGMPARRRLAEGIWLVRPLLDVPRKQVQEYLSAIRQTCQNDASNADLSRTRARIRHSLLPKLAEEYNPAVVEALVRLSHLAGGLKHSLREHLHQLQKTALVMRSGESVTLDRDVLASLPAYLRAELLRSIWRGQGWPERAMTAARWERLARWVKRPRSIRMAVGSGFDAEVSHMGIRVYHSREDLSVPSSDAELVPLDCPGFACWGGGRVVVTIESIQDCQEKFDLDALAPPLTVGPPQPGDRFEPLGMKGHGMALRHFLRSRRVPPRARAMIPVVRDAKGIIWVVGHRLAHRVRLTERTRHIAGLRWETP